MNEKSKIDVAIDRLNIAYDAYIKRQTNVELLSKLSRQLVQLRCEMDAVIMVLHARQKFTQELYMSVLADAYNRQADALARAANVRVLDDGKTIELLH